MPDFLHLALKNLIANAYFIFRMHFVEVLSGF